MTFDDSTLASSPDSTLVSSPDSALVPSPTFDDNLTIMQLLKRELADAGMDKQKALVKYLDTKTRACRMQLENSRDEDISDVQRRQIAVENEALVNQARSRLDIARSTASSVPGSDEPPARSNESPARSNVAQFNNAIIWHRDIRRCLKETVVPVFQNSAKIDFTRLIPKSFPDEPELKLTMLVKEDATAVQIVEAINRFLREFRDFYKLHLDSLFEILASRYMMKAFRKAGIEARLLDDSLKAMGKDLSSQLEFVSEAEAPTCYDYSSINTWYPVERCVRELFMYNLLKAQVVKQIFTLDTSTFTDVHFYAGKVELLMEASGLKGSVNENLSWNPSTFLDCVRADNTQFHGRRTDQAEWFLSNLKSLGVSIQTSASPAMAKKPATHKANKGKRPRKDMEKVPCSKKKWSSHSPERSYVLHPELRPQFKKAKTFSRARP
ncbi:hypothetical protein BGZ58_003319 [Dissophora ornata]|nr:hypothetical protein BGZ58_003319 [Dissophora ornata]